MHSAVTPPPVKIVATDLDTDVLKTARRGVYAQERIEKLDAALVKRFFSKGMGVQEGFVKVRPELQSMISFRKLNLLDAAWPIGDRVDAIFCRNVMIYFDKDPQLEVLKKMAPLLRGADCCMRGIRKIFITLRRISDCAARRCTRACAAIFAKPGRISLYGQPEVRSHGDDGCQ